MNNRLHSELLSFPDAPPVDHTHDVSEEDQIQAAIAMSLSGGGGDEDKDLKRTLAMSAAQGIYWLQKSHRFVQINLQHINVANGD